jgi:hypothetical protein
MGVGIDIARMSWPGGWATHCSYRRFEERDDAIAAAPGSIARLCREHGTRTTIFTGDRGNSATVREMYDAFGRNYNPLAGLSSLWHAHESVHSGDLELLPFDDNLGHLHGIRVLAMHDL